MMRSMIGTATLSSWKNSPQLVKSFVGRDQRAAARILIRLDRLENGLDGDSKPVGEGVKELRIPEGKGYRVYYGWDGNTVIILLCGGDKASQKADINCAKKYWRQYHGQ